MVKVKNAKANKVSSSKEDYLEAIYIMKKQNAEVGVKDISDFLGVKMASVTGALSSLSKSGLVNHQKYGKVTLTEKGEALAKEVLNRHELLLGFLIDILKVDKEIATVDACRIEHVLSSATFEKLKKFVSEIKK